MRLHLSAPHRKTAFWFALLSSLLLVSALGACGDEPTPGSGSNMESNADNDESDNDNNSEANGENDNGNNGNNGANADNGNGNGDNTDQPDITVDPWPPWFDRQNDDTFMMTPIAIENQSSEPIPGGFENFEIHTDNEIIEVWIGTAGLMDHRCEHDTELAPHSTRECWLMFERVPADYDFQRDVDDMDTEYLHYTGVDPAIEVELDAPYNETPYSGQTEFPGPYSDDNGDNGEVGLGPEDFDCEDDTISCFCEYGVDFCDGGSVEVEYPTVDECIDNTESDIDGEIQGMNSECTASQRDQIADDFRDCILNTHCDDGESGLACTTAMFDDAEQCD